MSIQPALPNSGSIQQRIVGMIGDIQRQVADLSASNGSLAPGSISGGSGGIIAAGTITATEIAAGTIVAGNIAANTITAAQIAAATITAGQIAANTITGGNIAANTITTANLAANAIDGMTITGATFRTNANVGVSTGGVLINNTGVSGYDATPTRKFFLDATTGLIQAEGVLLATPGSDIPVDLISGYLPAGANRYSNSTFVNGVPAFDTTGWLIIGATASDGGTTVPPVYGSHTMQLTATAATIDISPTVLTDPYKHVLPGIDYTFSHYVWPATTARANRIDVLWYNAAGTLLSTTTGASIPVTLGQWNRPQVTVTAPSGAVFAIGVHYVAVGTAVTSETFYVECFQMEEGSVAGPFSPRPDEILVQQINAVHIHVSQLDAISANLGTITAGTITGVTFQTGGADPRVVIDSTGIYGTDGSSNKIVGLDQANGARLTVGTSAVNSVTWHNGTIAGSQLAAVGASIDGISGNSKASLSVQGPGSASAGLLLSAGAFTNAANLVEAFVTNTSGGGFNSETLLAADGSSSYVRGPVGPNQAYRIDTGIVTLTWAASPFSGAVGITGPQFATAATCIAMPASTSGSYGCCTYTGGNPPGFNIVGVISTLTNFTGSVNFYWIAVSY